MSSSAPRYPKAQSDLDARQMPGAGLRLNELVERYLAASDGYAKLVALSALGLSHAVTESALSQFDEDYNISRYFHFRNDSGESFQINGFPQTHVSIDAGIQSIL
ncbi:MAG: hypothetical protein ACRD5K_17935 [Candidatus Acidiferrales bacterium]